MVILSMVQNSTTPAKTLEYLEFKDKSLDEKYRNQTIPADTLHELYIDGQVAFKKDMLECFKHREEFMNFRLTTNHLRYFLGMLLPDGLIHSKSQDYSQIATNYNRGSIFYFYYIYLDDFYYYFLGPMMIYTSGVAYTMEDSLEEMQQHKLDIVAEKIQLQESDKLLDIGCGWGTLIINSAKRFGCEGTGVTISKEGRDWAIERAKEAGVYDKCRFLLMDYRDIPTNEKYNKITCLEMAEHVGVVKFHKFCEQVYNLLEDDGTFFLQIAGLRYAWQWEDLVWGMFMGRYIFPGADASCPLFFPIIQLERAGFEIDSVDTMGVQYSRTIEYWYKNWKDNQEKIKEVVPDKINRLWEFFLAWSVSIAAQGSSTVFQICCHKNGNGFWNRRSVWGSKGRQYAHSLERPNDVLFNDHPEKLVNQFKSKKN